MSVTVPVREPAVVVDRASVLGCDIDRVTMDAAVERCERAIADHSLVQHMAINAAKLVALRSDAELRQIVDECELVTADGQAVVWASRLLGDPLPERVAGIDLMHRLFAVAEEKGFGVYILGARAEVLAEAVRRLRLRYPRLRIVGYRDGYFAESEASAVAEEMRAAAPDILFVAMTSPAKEYFLGRYGRRIDVPFVMGVGGSIDVVAGVTRRAPRVMQKAGLEWLFRLMQEPRRMFPRYFRSNARFIARVAQALLVEKRGVRRERGARHGSA